MDFRKSRSDVIQSVTQRWLYNFWSRLRTGQALPAWKDLPAEELLPQIDTLLFCDVVIEQGQPRFLIKLLGKRLIQSYGGDRRGEYLDRVLPPAWQPGALRTYRAVIENGTAVYNVVPTGDRDGREVYMERLLLPFSRGNGAVDHILASIETVSEEGRFEQDGLAQSPHLKAGCSAINLIEDTVAAAAK